MYTKTNRNSLGQFKRRRERFLHISQSFSLNEDKTGYVANNLAFGGRPCGISYRKPVSIGG